MNETAPALPPDWRIDNFRPGRWVGRYYISLYWVAYAIYTGGPGGHQVVVKLRGLRIERLRDRMARRIEAEEQDWMRYAQPTAEVHGS